MTPYLAPFPCGDYDVEDLFAGPGGWDVAAVNLGLRVRGFEFDGSACATRAAAGLATVQGDLSLLDPRDFPARIQLGSPPCQGFSMAGKGKGRDDSAALLARIAEVTTLDDLLAAMDDLRPTMTDEKTLLALEPLRWALTNLPDVLAWEQVPAVLPIWEVCARILERNGYTTATGKLTSEMFGVPQTRIRAILVARSAAWTAKRGPVALPAPTHSKYHNRTPEKVDAGVPRWVSMAQALGWGMDPRPSMTVTGGGSATGGAEPFGNGARKGIEKEMDEGRYVLKNGAQANATVRDLDQPASTIVGSMDNGDTRWVQRSNYSGAGAPGATAAERGLGSREVDQPSSTLTSKGFSWAPAEDGDRIVFAGAGAAAERTSGQVPRELDEPSHTVTGKATAAWKVSGTSGTPRGGEPTHLVAQVGASRLVDGERPTREVSQPAFTVTGGDPVAGGNVRHRWEARSTEEAVAGFNNQSGTAYDLDEQAGGPATALAGREIVGARGANANRFNGSTKSRNDGWRVTPDEAATLQTFPVGYPWQGNKSQVFQQIGNAIPCLLAAHVIAAAVGIPFQGFGVPVDADPSR